MWQWKATSPERVTELTAKGINSAQVQDAQGALQARGTYTDGQYKLWVKRALKTDDKKDLQLDPGVFVPIAFSATRRLPCWVFRLSFRCGSYGLVPRTLRSFKMLGWAVLGYHTLAEIVHGQAGTRTSAPVSWKMNLGNQNIGSWKITPTVMFPTTVTITGR